MPEWFGGSDVPETVKSLYRGRNPVDVPRYSLADVVRYVIPTLKRSPQSWLLTDAARRIGVPEPTHPLFSFRALVNLFLLSPGARWLIPLGPHFVGMLLSGDEGSGVLVTPEGDMRPVGPPLADDALPPEVAIYKSRVEWEGELPVRLYPFSRPQIDDHSPRVIAIDPRYSFGNPIIAVRNLRTDVIAGRFRAGESVSELAEDLEIPAAEVEEAIRYESGFTV
jgi:uncharacterized protein (DUF433 family)